MKERPVLFSGPMVRAILEGRKTQTRRIVNPQPVSVGDVYEKPYGESVGASVPWQGLVGNRCPYGQIGDGLWVRETWCKKLLSDGYVYRATYENVDHYSWKPSIFMPRPACRILLEITNVRVERLQDITEADAEAEGIDTSVTMPSPHGPEIAEAVRKGKLGFPKNYVFAKEYFQEMWDWINGKRASWQSNPWVWVIEFKIA